MSLCCEVLTKLQGRTLVSAESCTGGGIGAALTAVPGSSEVYKGGIISYTNWVKANVLHVPQTLLDTCGAVSAVSVTGLAGPGGDEFGNPVGTVFLGYSSGKETISREFHFQGGRDAVRVQAVEAALKLVLERS